MKKILSVLAMLMLCAVMACNNNKPATKSKDTTQTAVTVQNKKVAVINNPDKNYAKLATVPDPCIKCIIGVVQTTDEFKKIELPANSSNIKYEINWVPAETSADTASKHVSTNALKLDIIDKGKSGAVLLSFIYDNTASKLFSLKDDAKTEVKVDENALKKIRRACYWGVASAK